VKMDGFHRRAPSYRNQYTIEDDERLKKNLQI
jgi:hypothetical protein